MSNVTNETGKVSQPKKGGNQKRQNGRSNKTKTSMRGKQGRKDSNTKRVNLDNARVDKVEKDIVKDMHNGKGNDISEYGVNQVLLDAAGRLPFSSILGNGVTGGSSQVIPGIMVLNWDPAWGPGNSPIALNQATRSYYSKVVHANSRNYNYTGPDLMVLTEAGIEVFEAITNGIRLYGIARAYSERNLYYADGLIAAMGFSPDDIHNNLSQMWFDLNNLIERTRQIWVPTSFPILRHRLRLASEMYTDAEGYTSQVYFWNRRMYYMFSETGLNTGSALVPVMGNPEMTFEPNKQINWSQYLSMVDKMITALTTSEDRGIIYGDLLNCYGSDGIFAMSQVPFDYQILPHYSAGVLTQIENLTTFPYEVMGLRQNEEMLVPMYGNAIKVGSQTPWGGMSDGTILNFHTIGQPTPEMILEATRYTSSGCTSSTISKLAITGTNSAPTYTVSEEVVSMPTAFGTEVITQVFMVTRDNETGGITSARLQFTTNGSGAATSTKMSINDLCALMAFDWHPFIIIANAIDTSGDANVDSAAFMKAYGDYDNYLFLPAVDLKKINDVALFGEWGVPHI